MFAFPGFGILWRMTLDLTDLSAALAANELTVLTAPPGTGKTTAVPPALLEAPWLGGRKILVLEPRRLAARRAAQYIAERLGERPGETVGWQVRLERRIGPRTRIEFLTEGLLARRILSDPELADVGLIVFDEFHERSLTLDVAFALAREVREGLRPDLRLLVMSATIQEGILPGARFLSVPAKAYPVDVRYLGARDPVAVVRKALREEEGSVLCFLPGEGEIRAVAEALSVGGLPPNVRLAPLYAALDRRAQDAAVAPPADGGRKVVLATSIAESSLTIEGIRVVVDSGLARVPRYAPRNGLTRLITRRIPLDRADQRAGRAGRLCAGVCYRLWDEAENAVLPKASQPEILDADLTQTALLCAEWGSHDLPWLTPPPPSAWARARTALRELGAVDAEGHITDLGHAMARFPVHPALAAMMLRLRAIDPFGGALLAALCSEGEKFSVLRRTQDFRRVVELALRERPRELWQLAERWRDGVWGISGSGDSHPPHDEAAHLPPSRRSDANLPVDALVPYLLWAFPGHLARRRDKASGRYLLAAGFGAALPPDSPLINAEWLLAVRMSDADAEAKLLWAAPLDPRDLDLLPKTTRTRIEWDKAAGRLVAAEETCIGALVLRSRPLREIPREARAEAERCRLRHQGLPWDNASRALRDRIAFLRRALPGEGWPATDDETLLERLVQTPGLPMADALRAALAESGHTLRELDIEAPARFVVPSGSEMRVRYDLDQPYVAVRIQEVFGLKATPRLAKGRVPLLLHLLSPAQRPVQITADLASFWANGYAIVRKDLRGRYPKHHWPEDPTNAVALRGVSRRAPPTP